MYMCTEHAAPDLIKCASTSANIVLGRVTSLSGFGWKLFKNQAGSQRGCPEEDNCLEDPIASFLDWSLLFPRKKPCQQIIYPSTLEDLGLGNVKCWAASLTDYRGCNDLYSK